MALLHSRRRNISQTKFSQCYKTTLNWGNIDKDNEIVEVIC